MVAVVVALLVREKAHAGNGTMSLSPASGTFQTGQPFQVAVTIDGGGTAFNAAQATVTTSQTVEIQQVNLGDCDFAFVKTPTQANTSFAGAILGGSTESCTVYTLTLQATEPGIGYVSLTNAAIKQYKTAQEILSSTTDGRYTFLGSSEDTITQAPTQPPIAGDSGAYYYDISYGTGTPHSPIEVILDQNSINQRKQALAANSRVSSVTFKNVPEGVHTISTISRGKRISHQIINVDGSNKSIAFGKENNPLTPPWVWIVGAIAILIMLAGLSFYLYKMYPFNKNY